MIGRTGPITGRGVGQVLATGAAGVVLIGGLAVVSQGADVWGQLAQFIVGFPLLVASAFMASRRPEWNVGGAMLLMAFIGTLTTNQGIPAKFIEGAIWLLVLGVLAAMVASRLNSGGASRVVIWPGVAALVAYLAFTVLQIPLAETTEIGVSAFLDGPAFILAFIALAYSAWSPEVRWRIAQAFVLVALAVGTYALFRLLTGPTAAELAVERKAGGIVGELALIGSFGSRQELSAWAAIAVPLLFAFALASRGRWRWLSGAALALILTAVLGSEVRTALVAAAVGIGFAAGLYHVARAFRGEAVAALLAIVGLLAVGMVGFSLTVGGDSESQERFANILTPGEDKSFQSRVKKWDLTLDEINEHPLGEGLGTTGSTQRLYSDTIRLDNRYIDNSYLQLGVQQGYPGWILFGISALLIGYMLVRATVATLDRRLAVLGIGAAASLACWFVLLITGDMFTAWGALLLWMLLGLGVGGFVSPLRRNDE